MVQTQTGRGSWQHAVHNHAAWYVWLFMAWYVHKNHRMPNGVEIAEAVGCSKSAAWSWRKKLYAEGVIVTVDDEETLFAWPEYEHWSNWPVIQQALRDGVTCEQVAAIEAV